MCAGVLISQAKVAEKLNTALLQLLKVVEKLLFSFINIAASAVA